MTTRLNARLDPALAARVEHHARTTHRTASAVLRTALEQYLEREQRASQPFEALQAIGLIGCADGPPDLSTTYRTALTEGLAAKSTPAASARPRARRRPRR